MQPASAGVTEFAVSPEYMTCATPLPSTALRYGTVMGKMYRITFPYYRHILGMTRSLTHPSISP